MADNLSGVRLKRGVAEDQHLHVSDTHRYLSIYDMCAPARLVSEGRYFQCTVPMYVTGIIGSSVKWARLEIHLQMPCMYRHMYRST